MYLGHAALHKRILAEALGLITDSLKKRALKVLAENVGTATDAFVKKTRKYIADLSIVVTDVFGRIASHKRGISEPLGVLTDPAKKRASLRIAENITASETILKKAWKSIHDTAISIVDAIVKKSGKLVAIVEPTLSISVVFTWAYSTQRILDATKKWVLHVIGEPVSFSELLTKSGEKQRTISEPSISITDSLKQFKEVFQRTFIEALVLIEGLNKKLFFKKTEPIGYSELTVKVRRVPRTASDSMTSSDSLRKRALKTIAEVLGILEVANKRALHKMVESMTIPDTLHKFIPKVFVQPLGAIIDSTKKLAIKTFSDTIVPQELFTKKALHKMVEALSVSEVVHKSRLQFRSFTDLLLVSETVVRFKRGIRQFSEILIISEFQNKRAGHVVAESVNIIEAFIKHHRFIRTFADVLTIAQHMGNFHKFIIELRDTLGGPGFGGALRRHFGGRRPVYGTREP